MNRDNNPIGPAIRTRSDPFLIDPRCSGATNPRIGMETSKMTCKGRVCDLGEWFRIRRRSETKLKAVRCLLSMAIWSTSAAVEHKIQQCVHQQKTIRLKRVNDGRIRGDRLAKKKVSI